MPATTSNSTQRQLLNDHDLRRRPVTLPSERFNTRATHIQFCPTNLGNSGAVTDRLPANGLEARLLPAMSVLFIGLNLRVRQSLFVVTKYLLTISVVWRHDVDSVARHRRSPEPKRCQGNCQGKIVNE